MLPQFPPEFPSFLLAFFFLSYCFPSDLPWVPFCCELSPFRSIGELIGILKEGNQQFRLRQRFRGGFGSFQSIWLPQPQNPLLQGRFHVVARHSMQQAIWYEPYMCSHFPPFFCDNCRSCVLALVSLTGDSNWALSSILNSSSVSGRRYPRETYSASHQTRAFPASNNNNIRHCLAFRTGYELEVILD